MLKNNKTNSRTSIGTLFLIKFWSEFFTKIATIADIRLQERLRKFEKSIIGAKIRLMERNYLTKRKGLDIIQEFLKLKQPKLKKFIEKSN